MNNGGAVRYARSTVSGCRRKIRYRTEIDAKLSLLAISRTVSRRKEDSRCEKTPIRAYRCGRCRGWHLTSMPLNSVIAPV